jgi:hypothetical protein
MTENLDLLGDPIPENFGGRGRPPHIPTKENRNKVRLLLAFGWTNPRIARALRIAGATLRRHYFPELRQRDEAREQLEANHKYAIYRAAMGGNVGALKELGRLIDRDSFGRTMEDIERAQREPRAPELGKKERAARAAETAGEGTDWGGDLLPGTVETRH